MSLSKEVIKITEEEKGIRADKLREFQETLFKGFLMMEKF